MYQGLTNSPKIMANNVFPNYHTEAKGEEGENEENKKRMNLTCFIEVA